MNLSEPQATVFRSRESTSHYKDAEQIVYSICLNPGIIPAEKDFHLFRQNTHTKIFFHLVYGLFSLRKKKKIM